MADITLRCTTCDRSLTVSEFADQDALRCPDCGARLGDAPPGADSWVQLKRKPEPEPEPADDAPNTPSGQTPGWLALWLGPSGWRALLPLAHWAVFLVLLLVLRGVFRMRFDALVRWVLGG